MSRKLQYKENFRCLVLDNPEGVHWTFPFDKQREKEGYDLEILFTDSLDDLHQKLPSFLEAGDDRLRWLAYPKKSGRLASDINRDIIWKILNDNEFQPVSMISLDTDWSVMRVRNNQYVTNLKKEKTSMPDELKKLLENNPDCHDYFKSLSNSNKKEYMRWVNSAKREETRKGRLERIRSLLRDRIPNPYSGR